MDRWFPRTSGSGDNFPLEEGELPALFECSGMESTSKTLPTVLNMQNIAREAEMIKRKEQGV